jgi:ribosomal protein S18 acetylase RimI-like enzyme
MNFTGSVRRILSHDPAVINVKKLDAEQFPTPWSNESWAHLNWDHHLLFIAEIEGTLVGFCLFSFIEGDDSAHLLKICLDSSHRGSGIADHFWLKIIHELKTLGGRSVYLEVEAQNVRAIHFYRKNHFKQLRTIKGFYSSGSDALTMSLTL